MGAVRSFLGFGALLGAALVTLRSLDSLLYDLDEKRPARIQQIALERKVLAEEHRLNTHR